MGGKEEAMKIKHFQDLRVSWVQIKPGTKQKTSRALKCFSALMNLPSWREKSHKTHSFLLGPCDHSRLLVGGWKPRGEAAQVETRERKQSGRPLEALPHGGGPWRMNSGGGSDEGVCPAWGPLRQRETLRSFQGVRSISE